MRLAVYRGYTVKEVATGVGGCIYGAHCKEMAIGEVGSWFFSGFFSVFLQV